MGMYLYDISKKNITSAISTLKIYRGFFGRSILWEWIFSEEARTYTKMWKHTTLDIRQNVNLIS